MTASSSAQTTSAVAILGAGAWGSTIAWMLAREGRDVRLWTRSKEQIERIRESGRLDKPIPVELPSQLILADDLAAATDGAEIVVMACTSQSMREMTAKLRDSLNKRGDPPIVVSVVKGLELKTLKRMSEVILDEFPEARVFSLSGPNLAFEIRSGLPAAAVVAGQSLDDAKKIQKALSAKTFRLYASDDLTGVELGGTLKNIIAIAAGGVDGLNLGVNAKSAVLTRGLSEMKRFSVALGARESTLYGLSGMGDLFATCQGSLSRNYRIGHHIARGSSLEESLKLVEAVAEGVNTTFAVCELSEKLGQELPIAQQVKLILEGQTTPEKSIISLMGRPLSTE